MSKLSSLSEQIQRIYDYAEDPERFPSLLESFEEIGDSDIRDADLIDLLEPHFKRALSVAKLRDFSRPSIDIATLTVSRDLRMRNGNTEAYEILGQFGTTPKSGTLIFEPESELWDKLTNAYDKFKESGRSSFVYNPAVGAGLVGRLLPSNESSSSKDFTLTLLAWGSETPLNLSGLESFALTKAERRLLSHLARGETLVEAARSIGVSGNTVRTQAKSIYQKTGCHSLSSLIAMTHMASSLARLSSSLEVADESVPRPHRRFTHMKDGRKLAYRCYGDRNGNPILVLTGGFAGSYLGAEKELAARETGQLLMVPDRPGIGESDRDPKRTLRSWASDLSRWLKENGCSSIQVIVNAHMAKTAVALAADSPDLVSAILFLNPRFQRMSAGALPAHGLRLFGQRLVDVALRQPRVVVPVTRLFLKQAPNYVRARLVKTLASGVPSDQEFLDRQENMSELLSSIADAQLETSFGFADDISMLADDEELSIDNRINCEAWFGCDVSSPQLIDAAKNLLPQLQIKTIPDSGQMMFHSEFSAAINWCVATR